MKINFDSVVWLLIFICGCVSYWMGIKAKKVEEKRQAEILSIILAIGFFVICILGIFEHVLKDNHSQINVIKKIELFVAGMMLGIYLVMLIFRHFKLLTKTTKLPTKFFKK
jgi:RsiW-degrading membrane proteinase PrsW (M82 family)